jgi:cellobiose transport system permease protein
MTDTVQRAPIPRGKFGTGRLRRIAASGAAGEPSGIFTRYPFLAVVVLLSSFPIYWTFTIASQTNAAIGESPPPFLPGGHFLANARRVFATIDFAKALINSIIVAGAITISMLTFCSMAGFAFAKLRFRGRNALLLVVISTMMCPVQLGVIPLYIEMQKLGWVQNLMAVIVPSAVTGFGVVFMRQYTLQAVPDELLEAGRMDGCSSWGLYWHVVLPALRPAMAVLGLLTFMQAWNDFMWPVIVLSPQNPTVQVAISTLAAGHYMDYTLVLAGTALSTLPVLVVFGLFGRQIIGGVMEGAVKG